MDEVMVDRAGHAVVLVDEEYGYRYHAWFTGMTPAELETFWAAIPKMEVHYMNPTKSLPGRWETVETTDDLSVWNGAQSGPYYRAHIHWEDDSSLTAPDGRVILHAGFERRGNEDSDG